MIKSNIMKIINYKFSEELENAGFDSMRFHSAFTQFMLNKTIIIIVYQCIRLLNLHQYLHIYLLKTLNILNLN